MRRQPRSIAWARLLSNHLFPGKPHRNYIRFKRQLEPIFLDVFPNWTRTSARTEILPRARIPKSVIHHWKSQWTNDPAWRPWNTDAHGTANRIFTDEQEAELLDVILSQYIAPGKQFVASTFRELAQAFYVRIGGNPDEFKCSDHFIDIFKSRHRLSSRKPPSSLAFEIPYSSVLHHVLRAYKECTADLADIARRTYANRVVRRRILRELERRQAAVCFFGAKHTQLAGKVDGELFMKTKIDGAAQLISSFSDEI
jgi:hypothetical protein